MASRKWRSAALFALAEIDDAVLARDRNGLDETALTELRLSIAASGLRMPVELFELSEPRPPHRYGLLSGLRRLHAYRALHELTGWARGRGEALESLSVTPASLEDVYLGLAGDEAE